MSPVSSAYKKDGLVAADARVQMCSLATQGHQWLSVDNFEALNPEYVPTAQCLDHFNHELELLGGIETEEGTKKHIRVALLVRCFAPELSSFADQDRLVRISSQLLAPPECGIRRT